MVQRSEREHRESFDRHDTDGSGWLSDGEFWRALSVEMPFALPTDEKVRLRIFEQVDRDRDGHVSYEEWKALFDTFQLEASFDRIDHNLDGELSLAELREVLAAHGAHLTDVQLQRIVSAIDTDGDGRVSREEFIRLFTPHVPVVTLRSISNRLLHLAALSSPDIGSDMVTITQPHHQDAPDKSHLMLANTLGGVASRTLTAPLERIKLELQRQASTAASSPGERERLVDVCRRVLRTEGAVGLFRGNLLNCSRVVPAAMIGGACYTTVDTHLPDALRQRHAVRQAVAGGAAGAVATLMTFPMDSLRAAVTLQKDLSLGAATRQIIQRAGWQGLFAGVTPTLLAVVPFITVQVSAFGEIKRIAFEKLRVQPSVASLMVCGGLAGVAAQLVTYPLDMVRRRAQFAKLDARAGASNVIADRTWLALGRDVVAQRGFRGLYAGFGTTVLKVAPAIGVSMAVRDMVLHKLGDR